MDKSLSGTNVKNDIENNKGKLIENVIKSSAEDIAEGSKTVAGLFKDCNHTLSVLKRRTPNVHLDEYIKDSVEDANFLKYRIFNACKRLKLNSHMFKAFTSNYPVLLSEVIAETLDLCEQGILDEGRISNVFAQGNYVLSTVEVLMCRILNTNSIEPVAHTLQDNISLSEWGLAIISKDRYPVYHLICDKLNLSGNLADVVRTSKLDLEEEGLLVRTKYACKILKGSVCEYNRVILGCLHDYISLLSESTEEKVQEYVKDSYAKMVDICCATTIEEFKTKILGILNSINR